MRKNLPPPRFLKRWLLSFLLLIPLALLAQNHRETSLGCGTVIGPEEYKLDKFYGSNQKIVDLLIENNVNIDKDYLDKLDSMETMPLMNSEMFKGISTYYEIPIKAWIYRNNNGTGNIYQSDVYDVVDQLNTLFTANTNIRFYLLCDISIINNSNYTNFGDQYFSTYTANNKTPGAINVHFVISSAPPPNEIWGGKAYLPWGTTPYSCAVETVGFSVATVGNVLGHEIGHNLGLRHTHDNARQSNQDYNESAGNCYQEAVDRSKRQGLFCIGTLDNRKCEENGDQLCDTEADPGVRRENRIPFSYLYPSSCTYNPSVGGQDNWGDNWTPMTANIMSYSTFNCRNYFSPLQVGKMYGYIGGIGINYPTFNISGPNAVCSNQNTTFSVNSLPGVSGYTWEVPYNMNILSGQGTNSITIEAVSGYGGVIRVTPSCGSKTAKKTILNLGDIEIDGYDQACPYFTYTYTAPNLSNANYFWSVTNGTIISGQYTNQVQVQLTLHPSNQTILNLQLTNVCSNAVYAQKTIVHGDPPPPEQQCFANDDKPVGKNGIKPLEKVADMLLYPNPANTTITIVPPSNEQYNIHLFNSLGQSFCLKTEIIEDSFSIDVQNYPDGIYYVKLEGTTETFNKKLIIKN